MDNEKKEKDASKEEIESKDKEKEVNSKEIKEIDKLNEEIKTLKDTTNHWKNEYYKLYADMDNLRKEVRKDHNEALKYRIEGFVSELVSILDSFDIALKNEPNNPETKNYLIGFNYVYSSLLNVLKNEGIEIINPKINSKFDESIMQAIDYIEDEGDENLVKVVNLKGYKLHAHLIRPAMVVVSKKKKEVKENDNNEEK